MTKLPPSGSAASLKTQISAENYSFLQQYIAQGSGIVIERDKDYLLKARLEPLLERQQISTLNDLCALLRAASNTSLRHDVLAAMTTNETLFFRDPDAFAALRQQVIPELINRCSAARRLRVWSAASSSGQEAYSLAILLIELGLENWNLEIVGTDLSRPIVERARQGLYTQVEVNRGLTPVQLRTFFQREDAGWRVEPRLRRLVRFETYDLRFGHQASAAPFDLVLCRNVLIYFDVATKTRILQDLRKALSPHAYLLLGAAETLVNLQADYTRVLKGNTSFYQVVNG